jgi:hypothetical protein
MKKAGSDASFLPANNILLQQCGVSDLERCLASSAADDDDMTMMHVKEDISGMMMVRKKILRVYAKQ